MRKLIIYGEEVDLYPSEKINLNINLNDISDISTRNSTYTNTIKVPRTSKNIRLFDFLGAIGTTSRKPYEKIKCSYLIGDLPVINDGYLQVTMTTEDEFHLVLFDGILDLQERIKDKSIRDLLILNNLNHIRSINTIVDSLSNTDGFIYAFQHNLKEGSNIAGSVTANYMMPCVFSSTILKAILTEAGYTYTGELFDDPEFKEEVFTMGEGAITNIINFNEVLPDFKQDKFVKDVLMRYGQIIRLQGNNIEFKKMDSILAGEYGKKDFTSKLINIKDEKYNISYAKKNLFTWKYSDTLNTNGDGYFYVNNETLESEKTSYTSLFDFNEPSYPYKILSIVEFLNLPITPLIESKYDAETNTEELKVLKFKSGLYKLNRLNTDFQIRKDRFSPYQNVIGKDVILSPINWNHYLINHYVKVQEVFDNYKTITANLNLNKVDIFNLDFFNLYYFQQTGNYYYLNSLKYNGEDSVANLTEVKLTYDFDDSTPPNNNLVITITDAETILPNPNSYVGRIKTHYTLSEPANNELTIIHHQLDSYDGTPTGFSFYNTLDTSVNPHDLPLTFDSNETLCGWYSIQIVDFETNIESNVYQVYYECTGEPEDTSPSIDIFSYFYEEQTGPESLKDVGYRFNNFTPLNGTIKIEAWNHQTEQVDGVGNTYYLTDFTPDVIIRLNDLLAPSSYLYYKVTINTSTVTKSVITLL